MSRAARSCRGKRRFHDAVEARKVLRHIRRHSVRQTVPVRVYHCTACNGFHLTSQENAT